MRIVIVGVGLADLIHLFNKRSLGVRAKSAGEPCGPTTTESRECGAAG